MIDIQLVDITKLKTDAVVNAANEGLKMGSGVCGAIFKAAGPHRLQKACDEIGYCPTGSAVITPAYDLSAKYIIHAVGPKWTDGKHDEPKLLRGAYTHALELAFEHGCRSVGFPLISSGVYGYPVDRAWKDAIGACRTFLQMHGEDALEIIFAVRDDDILKTGESILKKQETKGNRLSFGKNGHEAVCFHLPTEPYGFLSNWYPSPFELDGIRFSSAEQYIMYQKCMIFGDEESAKKILNTEDTREQQTLGRDASGYVSKVWAGVRQLVALRGLMAKFEQNEDLREKLLATGDAVLVECARTDKIWACGIRLDDERRFDAESWSGENILGFALMEVRRRLTEK